MSSIKKTSYIIGYLAIAIVAILGTLTSCSSNHKSTSKEQITVSIPPIKYLVDQISGNEYDVNVMVASGACQETYEPTPSQMKDVAKSSLFFGISNLEFEQKWLDNIKQNNKALRYINIAQGIYEAPECDHSHDGEDKDHAHHHHGGVDPHFWLSTANFKAMAQTTCKELCALKPAKKDAYIKNCDHLIAAIDSVHSLAEAKFTNIKCRTFIIYHPALTYFAEEYHLNQLSIENEGKEPDANYLKKLVNNAKQDGVTKVFVQKEFDTSIVRSFAKEIGASIEPINTFAYNWVDNMKQIIDALSKE
jgi:ABC-type metal ion transport system, periplasmic component/surface adhesin